MKRMRRTLELAESKGVAADRTEVHGKRHIIHVWAFWGWLDGRIWPLMRPGGCISVLNSKFECPVCSKNFCSGFGAFCSSR
jgi:hypothetical protein